MKLFAIALATTLIALPALATPGGESGNTNCQGVGNVNSPCNPSDELGNGNNGNSSSNSNSNVNENTNSNSASSNSRSGARSNSSAYVSGVNPTATGGTSNSNATGGAGGNATGGTSNSTSNAAGGTGGNATGGVSSSISSSEGGKGGKGGQGGKGGYSAATGGDSSASGGSSSSSSRNKINNSSSSHSYYERETPVAPLLTTSDSATMEGVTVPLPTIGISGFYSNGDNSWNNDNRDDVGVTLGLRLPLGGAAFRDAALRREKFQIVKEAIYLKEKGLLTYTAFPEHYIALHGAAPSPTDRPIK